MYTGKAVRFRSFALVLALLLVATPVLGVVCEVECDQPPAASPPCHDATVPQDGTMLRGTAHACDHDHRDGSPALLTGALGRDAVGAAFEIVLPASVHTFFFVTRLATAAAMYGPPNLSGRSTSSHITVLRI
jgi:hypothetical protein